MSAEPDLRHAIRHAIPKLSSIADVIESDVAEDWAREVRSVVADLLSALDGAEGASGPTTAQEGQEGRSGQISGVSGDADDWPGYCLSVDMTESERTRHILCHKPDGHAGDHQSGENGEFSWPQAKEQP